MGKASEGSYCVLLIVIVGIDPNLTRKYPARTAAFHGQDKAVELKSAVFVLHREVYIIYYLDICIVHLMLGYI